MKTPKEVYEWADKRNKKDPDNSEYWNSLKMYIGSFEQIEWERTLAIDQLKQLGYSLGEKKRGK